MPSGGRREGSGRPVILQENKRTQLTISVSPETKKKIELLRKDNIKVGKVIDDLIGQYFDKKY